MGTRPDRKCLSSGRGLSLGYRVAFILCRMHQSDSPRLLGLGRKDRPAGGSVPEMYAD
ncbi:MAG: hypothetical protein ACI9KE_000947 [Polyangiales bacterium]|jgi:hypothetical protein